MVLAHVPTQVPDCCKTTTTIFLTTLYGQSELSCSFMMAQMDMQTFNSIKIRFTDIAQIHGMLSINTLQFNVAPTATGKKRMSRCADVAKGGIKL